MQTHFINNYGGILQLTSQDISDLQSVTQIEIIYDSLTSANTLGVGTSLILPVSYSGVANNSIILFEFLPLNFDICGAVNDFSGYNYSPQQAWVVAGVYIGQNVNLTLNFSLTGNLTWC